MSCVLLSATVAEATIHLERLLNDKLSHLLAAGSGVRLGRAVEFPEVEINLGRASGHALTTNRLPSVFVVGGYDLYTILTNE